MWGMWENKPNRLIEFKLVYDRFKVMAVGAKAM